MNKNEINDDFKLLYHNFMHYKITKREFAKKLDIDETKLNELIKTFEKESMINKEEA